MRKCNFHNTQRKRDTCNNPKVLEQWIAGKYPQFRQVKFASIPFNRVTRLDECYEASEGIILNAVRKNGISLSEILDEKKTSLHLFIQGGIDAINTAVLLKCMEWRSDAVQYQKDEHHPIRVTTFPQLLSENFSRRFMISLIEQRKFDDVFLQAKSGDAFIRILSRFLSSVIQLAWEDAEKSTILKDLEELSTKLPRYDWMRDNQEITSLTQLLKEFINPTNPYYRIRQIMDIAYWLIIQKRHAVSLLYMNMAQEYCFSSNAKWLLKSVYTESNFDEKINEYPPLKDFLDQHGARTPFRPNVYTLRILLQFRIELEVNPAERQILENVFSFCESISEMTRTNRNTIMHEGNGTIPESTVYRLRDFITSFRQKNLFSFSNKHLFELSRDVMLKYLKGQYIQY